MGICIGFSLLSIVEFAYFYTWRLWKAIQRDYYKADGQDGQRSNGLMVFHRSKKVHPFRPVEMNSKGFYNKETDRYFLR